MLTLLPILALAAAPPAPLAACDAYSWPDGWVYECGGVHATVEDHDATIPPQYLQGVERGVKQRLGDEAERSRVRLRLGGEATDVVRLSAPDGKTALVATLPRTAGERLLLCIGGDSECRRVLDVLASSPWRSGPAGGAREQRTQLTLAGKPVEVGEGCEGGAATRGGMIKCGRAFHAAWAEEDGEAQARRTMEARAASMVAKLDQGGVPYTRDEVKCAMAGFPARCVRVRATFPDGRKGIAVVGVLERQGKWFSASCLAEGQTFASKPCSAVFSEP